MKLLAILSVALLGLLLGACRTLSVDGGAVQCEACGTMWIYLDSATPVPGLYRMRQEAADRRACSRCQQLAIAFFESGVPPRQCAHCKVPLRVRAVEILK